VVDSACTINLTTFRGDFVTVHPASYSSRVGGVGVDVHGSGTIHIAIPLLSCQLIRRHVHALSYTPDMSSRSTQRIGRLVSVCWMQTHSGCEFLFPVAFDIGMLMVPTRTGVLKPTGNGLHLPTHEQRPEGHTLADSSTRVDCSAALTTQYDPILWHRRFGHLNNMQYPPYLRCPNDPGIAGLYRNCSMRFLFVAQGRGSTPQHHCLH
jgi:hypothetical protein